MNGEKLISVIIPAYNAQKTILRCVDSCIVQTYENLEAVIIDDGSTDETPKLLRKAAEKDARIRVFHTENHGVSAARNLGIKKASGDYLCFVDADDALTPNALESLYKLLTESSADISSGVLETVKDGSASANTAATERRLFWSGTQGLTASLKDHPQTYSSCGKLYSREIIGNTRFEEGRKIHEDSFFIFCLMMKQARVAVTNRVVYYCYPEQNSAGRAPYSDRMLDILYFAGEKKRLINENYPDLNDLAYNVIIKADLAYLSVCLQGNARGVKETEKSCIREIKQYRKYYIPMTSYQNKLFRIVTHGLYFPLKLVKGTSDK